MKRAAIVLLAASLLAAFASAGAASGQNCDTPSGHPVPRFVTLKFAEVRGRIGPSTGHPVRWEYSRPGLPVEIVAETADWRRVRDPDGEESWMHRRTLTGRRAVHVQQETALHTRPDDQSPQTARALPGAILWLERCRSGWCRLESDGVRGWVVASHVWGTYAYERAETADPSAPSTPPCSGDDTQAHELASATQEQGL